MPSPFVLVTPRMMAGATATNTAAVTFEYPVLNITTKFDHVIRASANTTIASLTVNRTVNTELVCSVPWTVTGTGVNPATAAYFSGSVFPSGTLSFSVGETSKTIQITISAGTAPAQELTATFKLDTPTGAVLGANTHFLFAITAPLSFPARVDPSEPGWVNIPSYATTPNPVTFATAADFTTASDSAAPNQSLILTTNLDAEGATFTLDALGTTAQPVFLRGNSDKKASFPELKNATLIVNGSRWVICNLRLNNVRILVRDGSYTQIQQNRFTNFTDGGAGKGAVVFESNSTARYTRIYGNDFIGDSVNPFKRAAVYGSALTEEINYKYLWIEKNLFKGFSDDGTTTNSAIAIGPNDGDATFDCHTYIRSNLFKDYAGTGYVIDTGCAGIACFDNTFELKTSTAKQWLRFRQGCTKPDQSTGNIADGNLWVAPSVVSPVIDELPTSTVFVTAANYTELVSRLDSATAGTCITLTNNAVGAYAGANLTKTLSGTSTKPIVIRGPVSGPACGVQSACPKIPFDLVIDGSYVYFYGIDFNRGNSSLTNSTTLRLATSSSYITIRRCWFFRKFGNLVRINGTRHTVDFCDFSIWGTQEYPTTDGLTPAPNSTKANWLPTGPFQCMYDGGSTATYMTLRRNYLHDCPFKMPDNYSWHVVTGFSNGDNPSEALENAYWLVKENLVWKAGHMDIATKTSHNTIQGNTIDGSGNKTNFNQRAGNYNDYLNNWYETGTYSPQFTGHGGYNKWIGNRLPSGKKFVTQCGDHVWTYTYTSSDPSDREHNSHQALYWGNIGDIEDGYRNDNAKTVVPTETQIVPSAGQNYTNTRATSPNTSATAPVGYSLVAAVKLTASDVGPGSAWIAP